MFVSFYSQFKNIIVLLLLLTGQYFHKSCVPGILSDYYNPYDTNPINLCEACGTHGPKRCIRNDEEQYYGSSGAFRCVTEGLLRLCESVNFKMLDKIKILNKQQKNCKLCIETLPAANQLTISVAVFRVQWLQSYILVQ